MSDWLQLKLQDAIRDFSQLNVPTENTQAAMQAFQERWNELRAEILNQEGEWRVNNIELTNEASTLAMNYKAAFVQFFEDQHENDLLEDESSSSEDEQMKESTEAEKMVIDQNQSGFVSRSC